MKKIASISVIKTILYAFLLIILVIGAISYLHKTKQNTALLVEQVKNEIKGLENENSKVQAELLQEKLINKTLKTKLTLVTKTDEFTLVKIKSEQAAQAEKALKECQLKLDSEKNKWAEIAEIKEQQLAHQSNTLTRCLQQVNQQRSDLQILVEKTQHLEGLV